MVKRYLFRFPKERRTTLIGPNCAGIISAGRAMLGIMPGHIYSRGHVGLVTRSGTLGYEAAAQMNALGIGQTTSVGIGGDPINGSSFVDMLKLFEEDPETEAVMMIGEIGGPQEAEAALFVKKNMSKPVIGYVAGLTAPKGRRMGHAGAIISAFGDTAAEKAEIMRSAGLTVAPSPAELGSTIAAALSKRSSRKKVGVK
jgi:malate-CoA ligase subunit alpha